MHTFNSVCKSTQTCMHAWHRLEVIQKDSNVEETLKWAVPAGAATFGIALMWCVALCTSAADVTHHMPCTAGGGVAGAVYIR